MTFGESVAAGAAGAIGVGILAIFYIFYFVLMCFSIVMYVLHSIGLMKIAKNLGIEAPWRSFIPFASEFLIGRIAEKSERSLAVGKKHAAKILTFEILSIATSVLSCIFAITGTLADNVVFIIPVALCLILALVFLILFLVFNYIAVYNIYTIVSKENATLYIVLSIIFTDIAQPIIMFCSRNKLEKRADAE